MPAVAPPGGEVAWPENEGVLGVVGVAPWATLAFCHCFYGLVKARKDWDFPRVLLDINTKLPSRGRHLQLGERNPSPYIAETIAELARAGATVAVVVCNTAHILYEQWAREAPIPVLHIVREAVEVARRSGARRLLALTSASLAERDLYGRQAEHAGLPCMPLSPDAQHIVNALIESIKQRGCLSPDEEAAVKTLIDHACLAGVDTVLLGCTELSVLGPIIEHAGLRVVDSNEALAEVAYAAVRAQCP